MEIKINPSQKQINNLIKSLFFIELAFAIIYIYSSLNGNPTILDKIFNLDIELSLPMWFSSIQLFSIALLFLLCLNKSNITVSKQFFMIMGVGFTFLSMDEATQFHENLSYFLQINSWPLLLSNGLGAFIPIYILIGVSLYLYMKKDIIRIQNNAPKVYNKFVLGTILFFLGAVIFELIGLIFLLDLHSSIFYIIEVTIEEILEMVI